MWQEAEIDIVFVSETFCCSDVILLKRPRYLEKLSFVSSHYHGPHRCISNLFCILAWFFQFLQRLALWVRKDKRLEKTVWEIKMSAENRRTRVRCRPWGEGELGGCLVPFSSQRVLILLILRVTKIRENSAAERLVNNENFPPNL